MKLDSYLLSRFALDGPSISTGSKINLSKISADPTGELEWEVSSPLSLLFKQVRSGVNYVYAIQEPKLVKIDKNTGQITDITTVTGFSSPMQCLALSPDEQYIYLGYSGGIKKIRINDGNVMWTNTDNTSYVTDICVSPIGSYVFTAGMDNYIRKINTSTGITSGSVYADSYPVSIDVGNSYLVFLSASYHKFGRVKISDMTLTWVFIRDDAYNIVLYADKYAYVAPYYDMYKYDISQATPEQIYQTPNTSAGGTSVFHLAVDKNGNVYGTSTNTLYRIKDANQRVQLAVTTLGVIRHLCVDDDFNVFCTGDNIKVSKVKQYYTLQ